MAAAPSRSTAPTRDLASLEVLVIDCQTTGATPERGHLLEVAWRRLPARGRRTPLRSHLVALPEGERIPPRISALTGITDDDLEGAVGAREVWRALVGDASFASPTPAVAHFARFEKAFLEALHADYERGGRGSGGHGSGGHGSGGRCDGRPFPFDFLCTHEIACRLLPGLPRRGLKALAGHLGLVLGETKRAAAHVEASQLVWSELARRLSEEHGVATLDQLRAWMDETPAARRGGREFTVKRETRLDLPDAPGVYRMLGRGGEVLYLGKATSLKRRVNSYFQKRRHGRRHTLEMLTQVHDLDVTETATPLEAALLESDEIKRLHPPYNVQLRERDVDAWFISDRLDDAAPRPGKLRVLGPLPAPEALEGLAAVRAMLASPPGAAAVDLWVRALELADDAPLDEACLAEGLTSLREAAAFEAGKAPSLRALLGLGTRLWRAWMEAREAAREEAEEEEEEVAAEDDEEEAPSSWAPQTPEQARGALESVVRRGAHLVRRGRWLARLSASALVWQPTGDAPRRLLVIDEGRVVRADDAPADVPAPPGWPRTKAMRLGAFDAATYDRLRVLTTEIRRLVAAGGEVRLCFDPRHCLDRDALARRMFWV